MGCTDKRVTKNDATFREANERIYGRAREVFVMVGRAAEIAEALGPRPPT
jgi:hypothetical protein